ncbi:MAG: type II secretion system protein GspL [Mariprofundales bacterium]|nr:type II secretion system protein GspL [Mariprofundales bacterium]
MLTNMTFWDGSRLHGWGAQGAILTHQAAETIPAPGDDGGDGATAVATDLPAALRSPPGESEGWQVGIDTLVCPLEQLLLRPFTLPLSHPRLLDHEVLGQELAEQAGIVPAEWWLTWHADVIDGGVAGLVFAMPLVLQSGLALHETWSACDTVAVDAWLRLMALVPNPSVANYAMVDADSEGIMMGVRQGGVWRGMRRLNRGERSLGELADEVMRSAQAMGFDATEMPVYGRLDAAWRTALDAGEHSALDAGGHSALDAGGHSARDAGGHSARDAQEPLDWRGNIVAELPDRASATSAAARAAEPAKALNLRHGSWAVSGGWQRNLRPWRKTMVLAGLALVLALGVNLFRVHQLRAQQLWIQTAIEAAFHRGLPDEKVMLDPLAQLRQAGGDDGSSDAWALLHQLQGVGSVIHTMPQLHIAEIQYGASGMALSGEVPNLALVNQIRDRLSANLTTTVKVTDTELANNRVRFHLKW